MRLNRSAEKSTDAKNDGVILLNRNIKVKATFKITASKHLLAHQKILAGAAIFPSVVAAWDHFA